MRLADSNASRGEIAVFEDMSTNDPSLPADEGVIFEVIDDGKMPPPEGSGLLTEEERQTVLDWLMRAP